MTTTTTAHDSNGTSQYMTRKQAAQHLNMSTAWLAQAGRTHGPNYHKFGNVTRYHVDDLNNWARQQQVRR